MNNISINKAMTIKLDPELPPEKKFLPGIRRAPDRGLVLRNSPRTKKCFALLPGGMA